ncbi:MAG: hypothetical protein HC777_02130 [Hyphomonadaceae bacterium]|nr:hypothetical protein [Hyphomonadaceae bacterium]
MTVVLGGSNRFERDDLVEALTESAFRDPGNRATQFAALPGAYQINFTDMRDGADAAALIMDAPQRQVTSGGSATMAMNRNGRRLTFERGATPFQVADMSQSNQRWPSRAAIAANAARDDNEDTSTDSDEESTPQRGISTPSPAPFRVAVVTLPKWRSARPHRQLPPQ